MTNAPSRALLLALVMVAAVCHACSKPSAPIVASEDRPNVVLIVADTLRADRIERQRNGKPLMPNLAALASDSWHFRSCRAQATWTKPSMATLFTSLYPGVHHVLFGIDGNLDQKNLPETDILPPSMETMAEYAKSHGYKTAGIQTNANIVAHFGFDQGFDAYEYVKYPDFHGDEVTDRALDQLEKLSTPYFLYVHYMDTHAPYETPADFVDADAAFPDLPSPDKELLSNYNESYRDRIMFEVGITTKRKLGNLSKTGEDYVRAKYDASAHFLDAQIGRLLNQIRARDRNTIIVLTSDHGEELWEHGSIGHGKTVYEELTRIPLIVGAPGSPPRIIDAPVELIDVLPTCAALLKSPVSSAWQGRDISPNASGYALDRPVFSAAMMSIAGSNRDLEAVIVGQRKLIVDKKAQTKMVYGLDRDPSETGGAAISESQDDSILLKALEDFHAANRAHPMYQDSATTSPLTEEQQENIRNIGYLR